MSLKTINPTNHLEIKTNKKGKLTIKSLQALLWIECRRITRLRYGPVCYSCGATGLSGYNWHTGHMLPKEFVKPYLKYDLRILRPQCWRCNEPTILGGNGAMYLYNYIKREGMKAVEDIMKDIDIEMTPTEYYKHYEALLTEYRGIVK